MVGTPLTADSVDNMIDTDKIYIYTGSESGYANGDWYYYDGTNWVSGGVYNSTAVTFDEYPTLGSNNAVTSNGIKTELNMLNYSITQLSDEIDTKQDILTIDDTPT